MTFLWLSFKKSLKEFLDANTPYKTKGPHAFKHWWHQRLTAIFILLIMILLGEFLINILTTISIPLVIKLFKNPTTAFLLSFWIIAIFYHGALGTQVIIEDYIHSNKMKRILIFLLKIYSYITIIVFFIITMWNINII